MRELSLVESKGHAAKTHLKGRVVAHTKNVVYNAYTEFCDENGLARESRQKLTQVLKRDPKIGDADRTPPGWDQQTDCYTGIQLLSEGEGGPN